LVWLAACGRKKALGASKNSAIELPLTAKAVVGYVEFANVEIEAILLAMQIQFTGWG